MSQGGGKRYKNVYFWERVLKAAGRWQAVSLGGEARRLEGPTTPQPSRLSCSEAHSGEGQQGPLVNMLDRPFACRGPSGGVGTPPAYLKAWTTEARVSASTRRSGTSAAFACPPPLPCCFLLGLQTQVSSCHSEEPALSWPPIPKAATDGHSPSGTWLPTASLQLQQLGEGVSQGLQVPHHHRGPPSPLCLALLLGQLYGFDF